MLSHSGTKIPPKQCKVTICEIYFKLLLKCDMDTLKGETKGKCKQWIANFIQILLAELEEKLLRWSGNAKKMDGTGIPRRALEFEFKRKRLVE
jgi:hypothetical protein